MEASVKNEKKARAATLYGAGRSAQEAHGDGANTQGSRPSGLCCECL